MEVMFLSWNGAHLDGDRYFSNTGGQISVNEKSSGDKICGENTKRENIIREKTGVEKT